MANIIALAASLAINGTGLSLSGSPAPLSITQAGSRQLANNQTIGTSWEVITLVDVSLASGGYLFFKNNDPTNYVQLTADGATGAKIFARLKPGEFCVFPVDSSATYGARANTAACECTIVVAEI